MCQCAFVTRGPGTGEGPRVPKPVFRRLVRRPSLLKSGISGVPGRESNLHGPFGPRDFKSLSAILAAICSRMHYVAQ